MRRRGCLISFGVLGVLGLVCCLALWFVGLPRVQNSIADEIEQGISTEIAAQIDSSGVQLDAGTHTISIADLEQQMRSSSGVQNVDDINFTAQDGRITFSFGSQGQSFDYTAVPVAQDGRFELTEIESNGGGFLDQLFPADKLADAVEGGVNSYFTRQGLEIVGVTAENDELVIESAEAGQ